MKAISALGGFFAVAGALAGAAGCSSAGGASTGTTARENVGTVRAALSAVGPDGATYSLPSGVFLNVSWTSPAGNGGSSLALDPTLQTQSFSVPTGAYTATLAPPTGGFTLTRVLNGMSSSVAAVLSDATPYTFAVDGGQTTSLTFHFTIASIGSVTFSTGTLATSLQVEAGTTSAQHGQIVFAPAVFSQSTPLGIASFDQLFSGILATPVSVVFDFTLTAPFAPFVDSTCAQVSGTLTAMSTMPGVLGLNVASVVQESSGGTGTLCITDQNTQGTQTPIGGPFPANFVALSFGRAGAPQTVVLQNALGTTSGVQAFNLFVFGTLSSPVYVGGATGGTANFGLLSQPLAVSGAQIIAAGVSATANGGPQSASDQTFTMQLTP